MLEFLHSNKPLLIKFITWIVVMTGEVAAPTPIICFFIMIWFCVSTCVKYEYEAIFLDASAMEAIIYCNIA